MKGETREKPEITEEIGTEEIEESVEEVVEEEPEVEVSAEETVDEEQGIEEEQKMVLPGDLIGTSEEFITKNGTYQDRGNIYSAVTGIVKTNNKERSISVTPVTNTPPHLGIGDIVIGQITDVKDSVVLL